MKSSGITLATRARKHWITARASVLRNLAVALGGLSDASLRLATAKPTGGRRKQKVRAQLGWRSLLTQLGTQRAMAAALDQGVLGNDMPRTHDLPAGPRILVLAAHQDDETIGAGGTLLLCAKAGYEIRVVYYTDGATSFGALDPSQTTPLRYDEARRVWRRIAGIEPIFWGYPNRSPTTAADCGEKFAALISEFKPTEIFLPVFLEQPLEHRRMSEVLVRADAVTQIPSSVQVWGYQITTRAPGNVVVDITDVAEEKYEINRLWASQNHYIDYAHLAQGRDMANSYYLKSHKKRRTAAHAETFLAFDAPTYVQLAREFLDLPARPAILKNTQDIECPPPNFFIVGLQKSGSYWLTALLDLHPQIRCFPSRPGHEDGTGEAHLFDHLAGIDADFERFARSMRRKLDGHFASIVPTRAPQTDEEREALFNAIRLRFNEFCQLQRLRYGKPLVGEKTTESVHHLDLLEKMYPGAGKICILRDPRDRAVSFHYHQVRKGRLAIDAELSSQHVGAYIDRIKRDYEGLLRASSPMHVLTYEGLSADPHAVTAGMVRFLGLDPAAPVVDAMVKGADFKQLANRSAGDEDIQSHFRKGTVGDWRANLSEELAERMVATLDPLTHQVETTYKLDLSSYRQTAEHASAIDR